MVKFSGYTSTLGAESRRDFEDQCFSRNNFLSMFSATDIVNFLVCRHLGVLEHQATTGTQKKPFFRDSTQELLRELGLRHERKYLYQLDAGKRLKVVQIPEALSWEEAVAETTKALETGADVVYQGTLTDGTWGGRSDFLVKVERGSALGTWSYEWWKRNSHGPPGSMRRSNSASIPTFWTKSKASRQNACTWFWTIAK